MPLPDPEDDAPAAPDDGPRAYGRAARLLHRLVLGYAPLGELLLDLDSAYSRPDTGAVRAGRHLFIAGLPRSGSSALLRRLYASGAFASHTYRDMPFVLAPALWGALTRRYAGTQAPARPRPRAHGDGLDHDYDTPEAFEEVFWRVLDAHAYQRRGRLLPHEPTPEIGDAFLRCIGVLLASRGGAHGRYLSKNNGNILRLPALRRLLPASLLVVPFRDPVSQARSLRRQHRRALGAHRADPFVGAYMGWLGHHAFGPARRCYDLGAGENPYPPDALAHWLDTWNRVYGWLLDQAPADALFVAYEDLCDHPAIWEQLARLAGLEDSRVGDPFIASTRSRPGPSPEDAPASLLADCAHTHARLQGRQRQWSEASDASPGRP